MIELDEIDKKAASVLEGYLVRKDLVRTFSRQFPVPTYVVEFMLGRYCASTDQEEIDELRYFPDVQPVIRQQDAHDQQVPLGDIEDPGRTHHDRITDRYQTVH